MSKKEIVITEEQIRYRAYLIWIRYGCIPGRDRENWIEAEKQLKRENCKKKEE